MNQQTDSLKPNLPAIAAISGIFLMTLVFESHHALQKTRKLNHAASKTFMTCVWRPSAQATCAPSSRASAPSVPAKTASPVRSG